MYSFTTFINIYYPKKIVYVTPAMFLSIFMFFVAFSSFFLLYFRKLHALVMLKHYERVQFSKKKRMKMDTKNIKMDKKHCGGEINSFFYGNKIIFIKVVKLYIFEIRKV